MKNNFPSAILVSLIAVIILCFSTCLFALNGDISGDAFVDFNDMEILSINWLVSNCSESEWCDGADIDQNGDVNFVDFAFIAGKWEQVLLPGQASDPCPGDGVTNVSLTPTLSWTAGSNTDSRDVYFGTTTNPELIGNQTNANYVPVALSANTTYYWRIDGKNAGGTTIGALWSFRTVSRVPCDGNCPDLTVDLNSVVCAQFHRLQR